GDEPPQRGERQQADAPGDQLRLADEDRADLHAPADGRIGDGAKVGRPKKLCGGTQRDTKTERAADLGEHRCLNSRRMMPKCADRTEGGRKTTTNGSDTRGSRPASAKNKNAVNMARIKNPPCAKLTISMRPKISASPTATSA